MIWQDFHIASRTQLSPAASLAFPSPQLQFIFPRKRQTYFKLQVHMDQDLNVSTAPLYTDTNADREIQQTYFIKIYTSNILYYPVRLTMGTGSRKNSCLQRAS